MKNNEFRNADFLNIEPYKKEENNNKNSNEKTNSEEEKFKMNETVKIWIEELGNSTKKKIKAEIEEVKGTISNEHIWELGYNGNENPHTENIVVLMEYLEVLEEMLSR